MKPDLLRKYYIRDYSEFYSVLNNRLRSITVSKAKPGRDYFKTLLLTKLDTAYNMLVNELDKIIEALCLVNNMHVFYREIFRLETNTDIEKLIKLFNKLKKIVKKIYLDYRVLIKNNSGREIVVYFKTSLARILSIYKRNKRIVESIKKGLIELSKLPDVTGSYVVIIAGMPQVGKSTLLSKLTRAKPEVSPFPFTTKTVIVGHIDVDNLGRVTLIDTPGLLDRPIDYKNVVELKAIYALKYLANTILYLFDSSPTSYYSLEEQMNVLESIVKTIECRDIVVLLNKVDITPVEEINRVSNVLFSKYGYRVIPISAYTGFNLDYVKKILVEKYIEKNSVSS